MEYIKSNVYTALTADELKEGDAVILANDLTTLRGFVWDNFHIVRLESVRSEDYEERFGCEKNWYSLAYKVPELADELHIVYKIKVGHDYIYVVEPKSEMSSTAWEKLFEGTEIECYNWLKYNKPLKWKDLNVNDVIRADDGTCMSVIGINLDSIGHHIRTFDGWVADVELSKYKKVEE